MASDEFEDETLGDIVITRRRQKRKLSWTHHHVTVFVLTFMSYAFFHATRKTFSNVKATISAEWTPQDTNSSEPLYPKNIWTKRHLYENGKDATYFLGSLDAIFLISYAVGLYISGAIGDRFNLRLLLTVGMCLSAVVVFIFGYLTEVIHFYNVYFYGAMWVLNGLIQATGWPTVVAVMANWFGKSSRGFVLGSWSACASVGNIIGAFAVGEVLHFGYEYAFMTTATMLFAGGILVFFGLVSSPREVGLPYPDEDDKSPTASYEKGEDRAPLLDDGLGPPPPDQSTQRRPEAIGFCRAILLPGVILYSLSYACLKLVNYAFFFWLPFYLDKALGLPQDKADDISIWYDVGGIFGGAVGGFISDRMGNRSPTCIGMLLLALPALFGYSNSPANMTINCLIMAVTGFFIGGPATLISSAIAADLGRQGPIRGNKEALATVTGIVDGTGSVGAAIGQYLVPVIEVNLDWHWVFYFFILMTFLSAVCILPILVKDIKSSRCCRRRRPTPTFYPHTVQHHGLDSPD